ncbi:MAG: DUF5998 family protein [Nocardioidaceae bacterium]
MANRHSAKQHAEPGGDARADHAAQMRDDIEQSGYYPDVVSAGLTDALAGEPVVSYVLHHEPTFDRDEVRRHMTVLVMTPTRLLLAHTDEHPPDDLLPEPYTSTTTEAVALRTVTSVVVTRMVPTQTEDRRDADREPIEALLTIGWGSIRRVELEPAQCADPSCEADHGYSGSTSSDDFSLRVSATADGGAAVDKMLAFARELSWATVPQAVAQPGGWEAAARGTSR